MLRENNWRRIIARGIINGGGFVTLESIGLPATAKIHRVWTVYDEPEIWEHYYKFDPDTGERIVREKLELEDLVLFHFKGVFLEDFLHDWMQKGNQFRFYGHTGGMGDLHDLLIEYEEVSS